MGGTHRERGGPSRRLGLSQMLSMSEPSGKNRAVLVHVRMARREVVIGPGRSPRHAGRCSLQWGRRTTEEEAMMGSGGLGLHRVWRAQPTVGSLEANCSLRAGPSHKLGSPCPPPHGPQRALKRPMARGLRHAWHNTPPWGLRGDERAVDDGLKQLRSH